MGRNRRRKAGWFGNAKKQRRHPNAPGLGRLLRVEVLEDRRMLDAAVSDAIQLFSTSTALFIENQGQWDDESVRYAFNGPGVNIAFTDKGLNFLLTERETVDSDGETDDGLDPLVDRHFDDPDNYVTHSTQFSVSFDGSNAVDPIGIDESESRFNYFVGDASSHSSNVPGYKTVAYENLYDGIDLHTFGRRDSLKYEFYVAPGADYQQISVSYDGIDGLWIDDDGSLHVETELGQLVDDAPYIYQVIDGTEVEVPGQFALLDDDTYTFGITGEYDSSIELVVDPNLDWGSYLGGSQADYGTGIAVDSVGDVLVVGYTGTPGWVAGGWDISHGGNVDGFVAKLTPTGDHLWSTYLGGTDNDWGVGINADLAGNIFVTGRTFSSGWVSGGWDTSYGGNDDGFVVKLSSNGGYLWSTYLGGGGDDFSYGIAADNSGSALITGYTSTSGWVSGGFDSSLGGGRDAFVVKLSPSGSHDWSTYFGGNGNHDYGHSVTLDGIGNLFIAGSTRSANSDGWIAGGGNLTFAGGTEDGFVAKLSPSGGHLWSTYVGGTRYDRLHDIAVDSLGNVLVTGQTTSSGFISGGWDQSFNGGSDGFVVKLSSGGTELWGSYLGGNLTEYGHGVTADPLNNVLLTGYTGTPGWVSGGWDTTLGNGDGYLVKLHSSGSHLWSSYFGGSTRGDRGLGIVSGLSGDVFITGWSEASGWIPGGWDTSYGGNDDGFVLRIVGAGLSASKAKTLTGVQAIWGPNYYDYEPSPTYEHGIILGDGDLFFPDASQPTYRFVLPNPVLSSTAYLSRIEVIITGKGNQSSGGSSGVDVSLGSFTAGELFGDDTTQPYNIPVEGGIETDWSNMITQRGNYWTLDVVLSALDPADYYDLQDVSLSYTYEGLSGDDLARLDQVVNGIAQIERFNTFHQAYLGDGSFVLREAYNAYMATSAHAIASVGISGLAGSVFGAAWGALAGFAYDRYLEPTIADLLGWVDLSSTLGLFTWRIDELVEDVNTNNAIATLTGSMNTVISDLDSLAVAYYDSLQNDGRITGDETPGIAMKIASADASIDALELAAQRVADRLVVHSYEANGVEDLEDIGRVIESYLSAMEALYVYDYILGSTAPRNDAESYFVEYQALLNLQDDDLPQLPTADAGGPYSTSEGTSITLDASGSVDPDGPIVSYLWDLDNDGQYDDASGVTANFSRTNDASYIVGLKVVDNDGGEDTDSATVNVSNVAPTADAGGPYNVTLGGSVLLDATNSDDPGDDIASYAWDLDNDGQFDDATGATYLFTPSSSGTLAVSVRVTDDDTASDDDSATLTVSVPPLPGDYDGSGLVDEGDYALWRSSYGQTVTPGTGADGNSDGTIDAADYSIWRDNLGSTTVAASTAVAINDSQAAADTVTPAIQPTLVDAAIAFPLTPRVTSSRFHSGGVAVGEQIAEPAGADDLLLLTLHSPHRQTAHAVADFDDSPSGRSPEEESHASHTEAIDELFAGEVLETRGVRANWRRW